MLICLFAYLKFSLPVLAIVPPGVKPLPNIPFVMLDCQNKDWGQIYPEWGPVGGWRDFGPDVPGCRDSTSPEDYIRKAKNIKVTLDDGQVISKPVGVGIKFTSENIQSWANRLNKPEFDNLAFIIAISPSIYGEVLDSDLGWALSIEEKLSQAFPNIPVFYQGTVNTLGSLGNKALSLSNKNIGLKCNGWDIDLDNAQETTDGILSGGAMRFADVFGDQLPVGYEPKHGLTTEEWYWGLMDALSHHPDVLDIQEPELSKMAEFKSKYNFSLLEFTRQHLGKTLDQTPSFWVLLRTTQKTQVCYCGGGANACQSPECCWTSGGRRICRGPQKSNYSYWLYQNDDLPGGKTVTLVSANSLPSPAKSHPYGKYTTRRTDQTSGNSFMYFDIEDKFQPPTDKKGWEITLTFVNSGSDKLSLEYINKSGQTIKKSITKGIGLGQVDNWIDYKWMLEDADFSGNKMKGADFRINCESDGDETIHRVIVKPATTAISASPTPSPILSPSSTSSPKGQYFYPGWQQMELKLETEIPPNCQIITYKENGFWKNFLSFLENLLFAPRKKKVWVKCYN